MKEPLIILAGPTGIGKTDLSLRLAKELNGEILSADSQAVYKGMDIGTAKLRPDEMQGIPHHLIDVADPAYPYDVTDYKAQAETYIREITERHHMPILTGGTGFYIQAVLYDIQFTGEISTEIREKYAAMAEEPGGREKLYRMLMEKDPDYAATTHANNVKKVSRALEFIDSTGTLFSNHNETEREREPQYDALYFVLTMDREKLYSRIDRRVDIMLESGLVDEVRRLMDAGLGKNHQSMQAIGYKEILAWLSGECSEEEAVETLKRNTRHLAKRQMTWFRRERDTIFIDKTERSDDEVLADILRIVKDHYQLI